MTFIPLPHRPNDLLDPLNSRLEIGIEPLKPIPSTLHHSTDQPGEILLVDESRMPRSCLTWLEAKMMSTCEDANWKTAFPSKCLLGIFLRIVRSRYQSDGANTY